MDYPNLSGQQFKSIINLVKAVMYPVAGAITILVSVALFVSYKDANSMREDLRTRAAEMNNEVKDLRIYAQNEIKNIQNHSVNQIRLIREEAAIMAKTAAENKIQQILNDNESIRKIIEETAKNKLYTNLEDILNEEMEKSGELIQKRLEVISNLIIATDRIRVGYREDLEYVDSLRKYYHDEPTRALADNIWLRKQHDYSSAFTMRHLNDGLLKIKTFPQNAMLIGQGNMAMLLALEIDIDRWKNVEKNRDYLLGISIENIRNNQDLNAVSVAFRLLEYFTEEPFNMFDFEGFENKIKEIKYRVK